MKSRMLLAICSVLAVGSLTQARPGSDVSPVTAKRIQKEVRLELMTMSYLCVFDNLAYQVDGTDVTLVGQVSRPTLKSEAEAVVKRVKGVEHVNNLIEVLPVSSFDNTLRLRLYQAIYGYAPLQKYALGVNKPIRIVVKNGHVTLEGVIESEVDKSIAGFRANGVADVLSVVNNLKITK